MPQPASVDVAGDGSTSMAYSRADLIVGTVTGGSTDASGFISVVYDVPLTALPVFIGATATAPDGGGPDPPGFALVDSQSTNGFTLRWWRSSNPQLLYNSRTISFMWVAILP